MVDGSRLDAVAHRLKLLRDVRAQVLPGCVTALYDLYRGITRHLAFNPDAATAELPRATAALEYVPQGHSVFEFNTDESQCLRRLGSQPAASRTA